MRLWAFGTSPYGLGLSSAALWSLTPREFEALREIWSSARRHLDMRFAELQSTLHNAWFKRDDGPFGAEEFMPSFKPPDIKPANPAKLHAHFLTVKAAMAARKRKPDDG